MAIKRRLPPEGAKCLGHEKARKYSKMVVLNCGKFKDQAFRGPVCPTSRAAVKKATA